MKTLNNKSIEQIYSGLESGFVSYKDLCAPAECDKAADAEGFSTLPASGREVIGRYWYVRDMESASPNIIVRETVYKKLLKADAELKKTGPHLQLVVFYGYKSLDIQEKQFRKVRDELKAAYTDGEELLEAVHRKIAVPLVSGHPTGGAVHVSIYDYAKKEYLDFGSVADDAGTKKAYYDSPEIGAAAKKNRKLLRDVMAAQGFAPYGADWWHFSYGDKEWAVYNEKIKNKNEKLKDIKYMYEQKNFSEVFFTEKFRSAGDAADFPEVLRIAVQKDGRLTEETVNMLNKSGVEVTAQKGSLFGKSRNFPVELLLVRDDDIPCLVDAGAADMGIVGENVYFEKQCAAEAVLKLGFGFCSLALASPESSQICAARDLSGKRVATSYPKLTADFFSAMGVKDVKIVPLSGSVEIAPMIGYADAIVDLVSTGSSLRQNKLKFVQKILDSQSVLIAGQNALTGGKKLIADELIIRLSGFLSARKYKSILMNVPQKAVVKVREILSNAKALTISVGGECGGKCPAQAVLDKDTLFDAADALKAAGASEIVIVDVERVIK